MRKLFLLAVAIACCLQKANSQTDKTSIAIFPFVSASPQHKARASQIQQLVVEVLRKKSNIELIDRSNDSLLVRELDIQIREQSVAADGLVRQGKILGAKQMIVGTLSNLTVDSKTSTTYNFLTKRNQIITQYTATINFALQLSDVETGMVLSQKVFSNNEFNAGSLLNLLSVGGDPREQAIVNAIKAVRKQISAWINESYPPEIMILKIDERNKKGNAETVLVSGIDASIQKGSLIIVNEIEMFDAGGGKMLRRTKKIAVLKVKDMQGDITICKVTDGEKVLEEKMTAVTKLEFIVK